MDQFFYFFVSWLDDCMIALKFSKNAPILKLFLYVYVYVRDTLLNEGLATVKMLSLSKIQTFLYFR